MSWHFHASGSSRSEVLANIRVSAELSAPNSCPVEQVCTAAQYLTEGMPESSVRTAECSGHINADGSGNVKISINC